MKRALGNTSRDRPAERWREHDEEDLERCIDEARGTALGRHTKINQHKHTHRHTKIDRCSSGWFT